MNGVLRGSWFFRLRIETPRRILTRSRTQDLFSGSEQLVIDKETKTQTETIQFPLSLKIALFAIEMLLNTRFKIKMPKIPSIPIPSNQYQSLSYVLDMGSWAVLPEPESN